MTAAKRKAIFSVLAIGIVWLVIAAVAWGSGADSKWILFAVMLALASFVNLGRVALAPESVGPCQKTSDPAAKKKQWVFVAVYFGVMIIWIGGFALFADLLTGLTPNERLASIFAYFALTGFVSMIVIWGVAAKLGLSRFKPKPWIRRLFNITDDY